MVQQLFKLIKHVQFNMVTLRYHTHYFAYLLVHSDGAATGNIVTYAAHLNASAH